MARLPFPRSEQPRPEQPRPVTAPSPLRSLDAPWKRAAPTEPPPLMFQVQFCDGRIISFAYADLRETRLRDAGSLQLGILGMEKYHVLIEGRHLGELATLIGLGKLKSVEELGPRTFDRPESAPTIDSITVETLTGPTS